MLKLKTRSNTRSDALTRDLTRPKSLTQRPVTWFHLCPAEVWHLYRLV